MIAEHGAHVRVAMVMAATARKQSTPAMQFLVIPAPACAEADRGGNQVFLMSVSADNVGGQCPPYRDPRFAAFCKRVGQPSTTDAMAM